MNECGKIFFNSNSLTSHTAITVSCLYYFSKNFVSLSIGSCVNKNVRPHASTRDLICQNSLILLSASSAMCLSHYSLMDFNIPVY